MSVTATSNAWEYSSWRRYPTIFVVLIFHLAFVLLVAVEFRPSILLGPPRLINVTIFTPHIPRGEFAPPPLTWKFEMPEDVLVPEPKITISPEWESPSPVAANPIQQRSFPQLDPTHTNDRPQLPATLGGLVQALSVELRILVLEDGSVARAVVTRSSGMGDMDRLAIEHVVDTWRYLPATINGVAVTAWATVVVHFDPIH